MLHLVLLFAQLACGVSAVDYIYSFGDSYSTTGFNTSGPYASDSNPIGNPAYPGATTSGGANWVDNIVAAFNTTDIYSYNFAYPGATVDNSILDNPGVPCLVDQVNEFASIQTVAPWTSSNSIFIIWMGINDIGLGSSQSDWSTLETELMTSYFQQADKLYEVGARNMLFVLIPPIYRAPLILYEGSAAVTQFTNAVASYNSLLSSNVESFKSSHAGVNALTFDPTQSFNTALDNPTAYGAANATCYNSDGVSCLWWNYYHPGLAIHKLMAQAITKTIII